jgi:hypothetical protein
VKHNLSKIQQVAYKGRVMSHVSTYSLPKATQPILEETPKETISKSTKIDYRTPIIFEKPPMKPKPLEIIEKEEIEE